VATIYNKLPEELKNEVNDKSQELCKKTQDDEIDGSINICRKLK
jgi:hypothetical protein